MRVEFVERAGGPERLVCEAELVFDDEGPLAGMKLVGFSVWRTAEGEIWVSLPARSYGSGSDRRFFDLLRSTEGLPEPVKRVKAWILAEYASRTQAA